jgi:predicted secreted protein
VCKEAAKYGRLDCLLYLHGKRGWSWSITTCRAAAEHNQLACLMYAHENKCPWDREVIRLATLHGSLDCLQYARDHGCPELENIVLRRRIPPLRRLLAIPRNRRTSKAREETRI